tara:strand:+ start:5791 stop:5964 length:174 start_codon:yes stop_codon:yes gene_type:complete
MFVKLGGQTLKVMRASKWCALCNPHRNLFGQVPVDKQGGRRSRLNVQRLGYRVEETF